MDAPNWLRASLLVLAGAGLTAFVRSEPPRQRWEYTCPWIRLGDKAELNRMGANGWEMVAVTPDGDTAPYFCFKRPLP